MAVDHYENFPVASLLLPRAIRADVVNLYRFARSADDIADEGDDAPLVRLTRLREYRRALHDIAEYGRVASEDKQIRGVFEPLAASISRHVLPITLLDDLLTAFEQDISVKRYATNHALDQYCMRSANPVGRLMLHLFRQTDRDSLVQSDAVCTALQRVNFLQDVAIDWRKGRVYLPQEDLSQHGVTEAQIEAGCADQNWHNLMAEQSQRCRELLHFGQPLGKQLKGRVGLEIRLIIQGGLRVLEKLEAVEFDVFRRRPVLVRSDWPVMLVRAVGF
ncbi:squalene synthase HpnC [Orrella marina]|uniref:Squalene synthase HpnC n=1 Tax=Orrella marina TaxID=2163011 RepID=A0A2R4XFP3_9BURK|nr:squalene synthase HpnC [Orrella marina]AWB32614.1 squalene synthase HpnC [Orrella marina]